MSALGFDMNRITRELSVICKAPQGAVERQTVVCLLLQWNVLELPIRDQSRSIQGCNGAISSKQTVSIMKG